MTMLVVVVQRSKQASGDLEDEDEQRSSQLARVLLPAVFLPDVVVEWLRR